MKFRDKILSAIDSAANQTKSLINGLGDSFDSFDLNSQYDSLMECSNSLLAKSNDLLKDINGLFKRVKDSLVDFSVTVPFNESAGETLDCYVEDGKLNIVVSFKNETTEKRSSTRVDIPDNCDIDKIATKINKANKSAIITIPKKVAEKKEKSRKKKLGVKPSIKRDSKGRFVRAE